MKNFVISFGHEFLFIGIISRYQCRKEHPTKDQMIVKNICVNTISKTRRGTDKSTLRVQKSATKTTVGGGHPRNEYGIWIKKLFLAGLVGLTKICANFLRMKLIPCSMYSDR